MAIVGPSGCGKTTLLKTVAGLNPESGGSILWQGRDLAKEGDFEPHEIGYVPQFSIAYDELTVDEAVEAATRLRVRSQGANDLDLRIDRVLEETGLSAIADRRVKVLSGGQKRRLGLAMELVSDPKLLLCDEVTSGLDPRSEREIVHLLHNLSRKEGRVVISVTHSLAHLELYDSILVLHEGRVVYHGPPHQLTHYFSVEDREEVYPTLAKQKSEKWMDSWMKHRERYYTKIEKIRAQNIAEGKLLIPKHMREVAMLPGEARARSIKKQAKEAKEAYEATKAEKNGKVKTGPPKGKSTEEIDKAWETEVTDVPEAPEPVTTPSLISQFQTLLARRWKIFFRDRGQVMLQVAILICFPILVTLFSERGKDNIRKLSDSQEENIITELQNRAEVKEDQMKVGSDVSGIIMFEVILLALMGSNNAAREVAGERQILEKEKFGGVRSSAFLLSKVAYLSTLVLAQSLWMAFFVEWFWPFRGDFMMHAGFLILVNAAITAICLGISSLARTAEQASLLSIYLVGFQLPLSGAVLALPEVIEPFSKPFISAYWGWAGSVDELSGQINDAVKVVTETELAGSPQALMMLGAHVLIGLVVAYVGIGRPQWD